MHQYVVVLQRGIDEVYVESFEPGDRVLTDGFHGTLNLTLKAKSPGSHYELPLIRQLADGSVPELQNLGLGCELAFVNDSLRPCPGRAARQATDINYTCSIDLRDCSGYR